MNLDRAMPAVKTTVKLSTNVVHPEQAKKNKKANKEAPKLDKVQATATVKVNGDTEEVSLVGDRISQEALSLYLRVKENADGYKDLAEHLKKILFEAGQKNVPVREGLRALETSATPSASYSYQQAYEESYRVLHFVLVKFFSTFLNDPTARQLFEESGVMKQSEDSLKILDSEEFKEKFSSPQIRENVKVTVDK